MPIQMVLSWVSIIHSLLSLFCAISIQYLKSFGASRSLSTLFKGLVEFYLFLSLASALVLECELQETIASL